MRNFLNLTLTHALATIKSEAKQTYMGYLWLLLDPLMFIGVYYIVFGQILGTKTNDFIVFLIIGIITFSWFQSSIDQCSASISNAGGLIKRIKINTLIFPISKIIHNTWQFFFVFIIYCLILYVIIGTPATIHLVSIPLIILVQLATITGITLLIAAFYPFLPDIKHVIQPLLRALLFLSGIFFNVDKVPENMRFYFYLNPMANLVEAYRDAMLNQRWPDFGTLFKLLLVSILLIYLGIHFVKKNQPSYAKVIP